MDVFVREIEDLLGRRNENILKFLKNHRVEGGVDLFNYRWYKSVEHYNNKINNLVK